MLSQSLWTRVKPHTCHRHFPSLSSHGLSLVLPSCHFRWNGQLITLFGKVDDLTKHAPQLIQISSSRSAVMDRKGKGRARGNVALMDLPLETLKAIVGYVSWRAESNGRR